MLKFLRKYNKSILAVGCGVLMVAFLIGPAMQQFRPGPSRAAIGSIDGQEVRTSDLNHASVQLDILRLLFGGLMDPGQEALTWLLMVREAATLGLAASQREVDELIERFGLAERKRIQNVARQLGVPRPTVLQALRDWVVVQTYTSLVYGVGHIPLTDRFIRQVQLGQIASRFGSSRVLEGLAYGYGNAHLSTPLLERYADTLESNVKISTVAVSYKQYLDQVEDPDDTTVQNLFQQYKHYLRGTSEPYGFGYKLPDRIQIEYLALAERDLADQVQVTERAVLDYYNRNPDRFTEEPALPADGAAAQAPDPDARKIRPYAEVRDQIYRQLEQFEAHKLADTVMAFARQWLLDQAAGAAPGDVPPSLAEAAGQIHERFKLQVALADDNGVWHTPDMLGAFPGLGTSRVRLPARAGQLSTASFVEYALSVAELGRSVNPKLEKLGLKVGQPSQVTKEAASRFLFRIGAVKEQEVPADLDLVRDKVVNDARHLAAYRKLIQEQDGWLQRAGQLTLEAVAEKLDTTVNEPPPFSRRLLLGTRLMVPHIAGVGQDRKIVDRIFEAAESVKPQANEPPRLIAIARDARLNLLLVRLDRFDPVARSTFEQMASNRLLLGSFLASTDQSDPLSFDALKRRLNYIEAP